ncbi:protein-disulfide reductase DsbD [Methylovulum psychrotolerans]|uniref:Thiol:disulfide interchange protein DsbD n=1 Tax=Methylovulum psychrotolerans TaxID=1704499 RepID=A0A2S5CMU4_9GAMM|nr:protein-disulfide reductase DsbD [Methylovulum psychrotolerans]POZ52145.1 protein-disulfide reductase DsbD [Methylovulum psychrotolerans]
MPFYKTIIFCWLAIVGQAAFALDDDTLLPPAQAFKLSAQALSDQQLQLTWEIADGYSVYRNNMRLKSQTAAVTLGEGVYPDGLIKHDEFLGDIEHYHHQLQVAVPLNNPNHAPSLELFVQYQACADRGVCYPPQKQTLTVNLPPAPAASTASATPATNPLARWVKGFSGFQAAAELLPPEQAFQFSATVKDAQTVQVNWTIAEGYYLYREKVQLALTQTDGSQLGAYSIPNGTPQHDEAFGQVQIFHNTLAFNVPLNRAGTAATTISLEAKYQGCADRGVCYPPMSKTISLALPAATAAPANPSLTPASLSEQDAIAQSLHQDSTLATLASFFGFGLLLAFTPCIFPMIPILSGIIIGHGNRISTFRAFLLSLSYVLASAVMYTLFGVLAALFGQNLQTTFQQPWIIVLFSAVFVVLSLSMFGFYHLELPKALQARLHNSSERHRDGSLWGAAIMGALSSLIVGPCVAAPLAGALIFISQTGNALLGGAALFVMGLGMGVPLLVLGASARHLLPKAGDWLNTTKVVFGVIMLAVAVWMLSRVLSPAISMTLWAMLLILPSVYLSALEPLPPDCSGWRKFSKGLGVLMLAYGLLLLIGVSMGNSNPLKPLQGLAAIPTGTAQAAETGLSVSKVATLAELEAKIQQAAAQHQTVMLDFYADWCISCKEMEAYTFTDARVKTALAKFVVLQADVTANNADDQALLARFKLVGPPAILFFGQDRQEQAAQRVVGYQDADTFLKTLAALQP